MMMIRVCLVSRFETWRVCISRGRRVVPEFGSFPDEPLYSYTTIFESHQRGGDEIGVLGRHLNFDSHRLRVLKAFRRRSGRNRTFRSGGEDCGGRRVFHSTRRGLHLPR